MSGSYRECSECGKRALSIATRCPGCGRELPAPAQPRHGWAFDPGRYLPLLGVVAALAIGIQLARAAAKRAEPAPVGVESSSVAAIARVDTLSAAASPVAGPPPGTLLVARSWTHVRARRSVSGEVEAVLLPGDTVLADSLSNGWYRVALEGEVLGYAHRSTLTQ